MHVYRNRLWRPRKFSNLGFVLGTVAMLGTVVLSSMSAWKMRVAHWAVDVRTAFVRRSEEFQLSWILLFELLDTLRFFWSWCFCQIVALVGSFPIHGVKTTTRGFASEQRKNLRSWGARAVRFTQKYGTETGRTFSQAVSRSVALSKWLERIPGEAILVAINRKRRVLSMRLAFWFP